MDKPRRREDFSPEEARLFIGKKQQYYEDKWRAHGGKAFKGWNWAAMLFSVEWLVYRKMYIEAICCFFAQIAMVTLIYLLPLPPELGRSLELCGVLPVSVAMGAAGNAIYRRRALKVMGDGDDVNEFRREEYIRGKGGVNITAASVCAAAQLIFMLA